MHTPVVAHNRATLMQYIKAAEENGVTAVRWRLRKPRTGWHKARSVGEKRLSWEFLQNSSGLIAPTAGTAANINGATTGRALLVRQSYLNPKTRTWPTLSRRFCQTQRKLIRAEVIGSLYNVDRKVDRNWKKETDGWVEGETAENLGGRVFFLCVRASLLRWATNYRR